MSKMLFTDFGDVNLSMDENLETAMSFFREEIDKLTHDDELTLMEIIEQASRKKRNQHEIPDDRILANRQSTLMSTPPLAPRNSQRLSPPDRHSEETHKSDRRPPAARADPIIRNPSGNSILEGAPYSSDEYSTSAVFGELDIARETYYDYGNKAKSSDASIASSQGRKEDFEGQAVASRSRSSRESVRHRVAKQSTGSSTKRIASQDGESGNTRRTSNNASQEGHNRSLRPNEPSVPRHGDNTTHISRQTRERSRDDDSVSSSISRSDPYGRVSTRESFAPRECPAEPKYQAQQSHKIETPKRVATPAKAQQQQPSPSVRPHHEPQGHYVKRGLSTPVRTPDKQPLPAENSRDVRSTLNTHQTHVGRTTTVSVSAAKNALDPPNPVRQRLEPTPRMSRPEDRGPTTAATTPQASSSETEAWKSMVQVLRETLDRQEQHIRKLESENEELRSENKELRHDLLTMASRSEPRREPHTHQREARTAVTRQPTQSDESIDEYSLSMPERGMERMNNEDQSVASDVWSLPHQLFIRKATTEHSRRGDARSQAPSRIAFSPPAPETQRNDRPPSPTRTSVRLPVDAYGYPVHPHDGRRSSASLDPRYFAPIPSKHAFSPGTKIVGDLSTMMHVRPDHLVPLSYMVDDYYGRRHATEAREARSEMRGSSSYYR